jgi:DinB superfamily
VLSQAATNKLGIDDIIELSHRVFGAERVSLQTVADEFELTSLCSTLNELLVMVFDVVRDLPDSAYRPQPDEVDGSDVWSVGQIIGHLAQMEASALPYWESVCGMELPLPPDKLLQAFDEPLTDRIGALEVMTILLEQSGQTIDRINRECAGGERAVHFALGPVNVRTAILGSCVHLADHHQQLLALASRP